MERAFRTIVAGALAAFAMGAGATQRTETVSLGATPVAAWRDAESGAVVTATEGARAGGLALLERSGRITTIALPGQPVALSGAAHRAVVGLANGRAAVVDLSSLQVRPVMLAADAVVRVVAGERLATAYVLGRSGRDTVVTAIDLKTLATRSTVVDDALPVDIAYDASSDRVAVLAAAPGHGSAPESLVQVFDGRRLAPVQAPARLGRIPRAIAFASDGEELVVLDHVAAGAREELWRPTLWVLDLLGVAKRSVDIGEPRVAPLQAVLDAEGVPGRVLVGDLAGARVVLVNIAAGTAGGTRLEAPLGTVGVIPGSGAIVALMPSAGSAAILSATGERLDTLAIGHAADANDAARYAVVPDGDGGGALVMHGVEGTLTRLPKQAARLANITGLWSDPADPGWGVFTDQQGLTVFAALFSYGAAGEPTWLVMSNGTRQADGTFSGVLFRTQGPPPLRGSDAVPVGIMRIAPAADGSATLTYVADGQSVTRRVERFGTGEPAKACRWTTNLEPVAPGRANFTALWSNPTDPGWGLALSHQGASIFGILFTYDEENRPAWMVMSRGRQVAPGQFSGELYRIGKSQVRGVGAMTLRFSDSDEGVVAWRLDGTEFRAPLIRQRYAPLVSKCG